MPLKARTIPSVSIVPAPLPEAATECQTSALNDKMTVMGCSAGLWVSTSPHNRSPFQIHVKRR